MPTDTAIQLIATVNHATHLQMPSSWPYATLTKHDTMNEMRSYDLSVFPDSLDPAEQGGNPTTIFLNADGPP
jgi:uncharacterized lipoprotein NlpE involved in copper resistance